ncbi:hypothetical protein [Mucilaginibacter sp. HD30]
MKRLFLLVILSNICLLAIGQQRDLTKVADSIRAEAEVLFRSEFASWYGSDIFSEKCKVRRASASGYLSYDNGKNLINVFYSDGEIPTVVSTISFGYDFNASNYKLDTTDRPFNPTERALYSMRKAAIAQMNRDTLFKVYKNANLNPIPIINNGKKMVYALTGPTISGVVLFGNDYLLNFDKDNNIIAKRKLHKNLIPVQTKDNSGQITVGGIHMHLPETGDFITATDICTLMLYEKFTTWKQHIVLSQNYTSIWDCERNKLSIVTAEEWKKTNPTMDMLKNSPK